MLDVSVVLLLQFGRQERPVVDSQQKVLTVSLPSAGFVKVIFIGQDGDDGGGKSSSGN